MLPPPLLAAPPLLGAALPLLPLPPESPELLQPAINIKLAATMALVVNQRRLAFNTLSR